MTLVAWSAPTLAETLELRWVVPVGANPDSLRRMIQLDAESAVRHRIYEATETLEFDKALESDDGLKRWLNSKNRHWLTDSVPPIVRASVYDNKISYDQEIAGLSGQSGDSRRPVYMRGSIAVMTTSAEYYHKVICQFFRRTKGTFLSIEEYQSAYIAQLRKLEDKPWICTKRQRVMSESWLEPCQRKGWTLNYPWQFGYDNDGKIDVIIKGRRVSLTRSRHKWLLQARDQRARAARIEVPRKISATVAQRALRELGIRVPQREAVLAMRQILEQERPINA